MKNWLFLLALSTSCWSQDGAPQPRVRVAFDQVRLGLVLAAIERQADTTIWVRPDVDLDQRIDYKANGLAYLTALEEVVALLGTDPQGPRYSLTIADDQVFIARVPRK